MVLFLTGAVSFQTTTVILWLCCYSTQRCSLPPFYSRSCFHLANPDIVKAMFMHHHELIKETFFNQLCLSSQNNISPPFFLHVATVTESPNASVRPLEFLPWNTNYSLGKTVLYCWSTPLFYPLFFLGTRHFHSSVFPPQSIYLLSESPQHGCFRLKGHKIVEWTPHY